MSKSSREKKYQAIKLYNSGQASLSDIKAMFRVTAVAASNEYSSANDQKDFLGTKARIEKISRMAMTGDVAKMRAEMRFKVKPKLAKNRAEVIADFALDSKLTLPHNWKRYGNLVKRTKRINPPRKGSSLGKIGRTRYTGFKQFNKDFDQLMKSLLNFTKDRKTGKNIASQMKRLKGSINVSAK